MGDDKSSFSRDDIFLLMESYRNMIESTTVLLEKQEKLADQNRQLIAEQKNTCEAVKAVALKLDSCGEQMRKSHGEWEKHQLKASAENTEQHNSIKHRINISYVILTSIVITLITILAKSWGELNAIEHSILKITGAG